MARRNRTRSSARTRGGNLDVAICERARVSRDRRFDGQFFFRCQDNTDLLSSGLPGSSREGRKRVLLSIRSGGGARWISAVLALPAGDGAILSGMEGLIGDRRTCGPADQRGRTRSRVC